MQLIFQLLDLHAERGLGDGASVSCMSEMQRVGQGLEITQLPQSHHSDKTRLRSCKEIRFEFIMGAARIEVVRAPTKQFGGSDILPYAAQHSHQNHRRRSPRGRVN